MTKIAFVKHFCSIDMRAFFLFFQEKKTQKYQTLRLFQILSLDNILPSCNTKQKKKLNESNFSLKILHLIYSTFFFLKMVSLFFWQKIKKFSSVPVVWVSTLRQKKFRKLSYFAWTFFLCIQIVQNTTESIFTTLWKIQGEGTLISRSWENLGVFL